MSLRKSPVRTPALLAACKANAQKSTGPRTPAGKARSRLNALRHGRRCRKLHHLLPEGLSIRNRFHYNWIRRAIEHCFRPQTPRDRERALQMAVQVWCQVAGVVDRGNRATRNLAENRRVPDRGLRSLTCFQISSPDARQTLTFWTQTEGQRARLKLGGWRSRAHGLYAGWYGRSVENWGPEPVPGPQDPVWLYYGPREDQRRYRSFRRAQAREARLAQACKAQVEQVWQALATALAVPVSSQQSAISYQQSAFSGRQSTMSDQRSRPFSRQGRKETEVLTAEAVRVAGPGWSLTADR